MALRWHDSDEQVIAVPENRSVFFRKVEKLIADRDPGALGAMVEEICGQLQKLSTDGRDFLSVRTFASGTWEGTARQVVYDVTEDLDESRWWLGLLIMDTAIRYPQPLIAYKPGADEPIQYRMDPAYRS